MGDLLAFAVLWALGWVLLWRVPRPAAVGGRSGPVSIVVPARDEAANLPLLLASLVPQLGPGDELVVVDDHSTDGSAGVAARAGATVVAAPPLPDGWAGKQWACHVGAMAASNPTLVFLDADTRLRAGGLARIAALGARPGLTSVQPFHLVPRWSERLAAFFNIVAIMGTLSCTPLGRRLSPVGAFGPCLATPTSDYRLVGGHEAARSSVLDDLALAVAYRRAGLPVRILGGRGTIDFRMYPGGLRDLVAGFTKNLGTAAVAVRPGAALAVAGWLAACVAPLVLAARSPWVAAACYLAVALQVGVHLRRLGTFGPVASLAYPIGLALFLVVFVRSLLVTYGRGSVSWKGRTISTR